MNTKIIQPNKQLVNESGLAIKSVKPEPEKEGIYIKSGGTKIEINKQEYDYLKKLPKELHTFELAWRRFILTYKFKGITKIKARKVFMFAWNSSKAFRAEHFIKPAYKND